MFIPRMWLDEVERIGKQRCAPVGYALQRAGELLGLLGLLFLLAVPLYLASRAVAGTFAWPLLGLLAAPVGIGTVGSALVSFSWSLARRKQFRYDHERRVSRWVQGGVERTYTHADWQAEQGRRAG